jgi:hypothetical protein
MANPGESVDLVFDQVAVDSSALPQLSDLPFPDSLKSRERPRKYTGIIKNKTKYAVSVPSANSGATLDIPAHSWIEFTTWTRNDVTVRDGAIYCLNLRRSREYLYVKIRFHGGDRQGRTSEKGSL